MTQVEMQFEGEAQVKEAEAKEKPTESKKFVRMGYLMKKLRNVYVMVSVVGLLAITGVIFSTEPLWSNTKAATNFVRKGVSNVFLFKDEIEAISKNEKEVARLTKENQTLKLENEKLKKDLLHYQSKYNNALVPQATVGEAFKAGMNNLGAAADEKIVRPFAEVADSVKESWNRFWSEDKVVVVPAEEPIDGAVRCQRVRMPSGTVVNDCTGG